MKQTKTLDNIAAQKQIINRLRRANGQLAALVTAVETGAPCREVITQLSAVSRALDRAGFAIISTAMRDCIQDSNEISAESVDSSGATVDPPLTAEELEKLFLMLA